MWDLFKAELLRFRIPALIAAAVHVLVLGFMSRLTDLAQEPKTTYQVFGMVYAVLGALLGLYQMGTYRRPNQWLNLLHRPLHRLRIAGALCGAGVVLLMAAIVLPIVLIALYQETLTIRLVDLRHWLLPVAAGLIALCGYLSGAYAALADRRYSAAVVVLPTLLLFSQAHGPAALAVQAVVALLLVGLLAIAFKPDLTAPPRRLATVVATALPVQVGVYLLLWVLLVGVELFWTLTGAHPLNIASPPKGGYVEAQRAEGRNLLLAGIAGSRDPDAPLWREQIALSEVFVRYPAHDLPHRNDLTNVWQLVFDDEENRIRWEFSHDRMRYVGHGRLDQRARGELGVGTTGTPFPELVMPFPGGYLFGTRTGYQYDPEQQRIFQRIELANDEVIADAPQPAGENLTLISNRAMYFYPGREAENGLDPLPPLLRLPLPGPIGQLSRVDLVELLDGYLVSFTYTDGVYSGEPSTPYQQVLRVDGQGRVETVARRDLALDLPLAYTARAWWLSPVLREICLAAQQLFAMPNPLRERTPEPMPRNLVLLAGALCLLSLLAAIRVSGRQAHPPAARWSWVLACGVIGLPALISLWLLYPEREQIEDLPLAQPAMA